VPQSPSALTRRRALQWAGAGAALAASRPLFAQAQGEALVVGQTASLTGPTSGPYLEMNKGILAAFDEVNGKGGIHGRPLRLASLDDGGNAGTARANATLLAERDKVLCYFACGGTASVMGMLPVVESTRIPLVAPATGNDTLRNYNPLIVHTRAGYAAEISRIVQQMATIGYTRCAIVHSEEAFGKSALAAFEAAGARHKLASWKAFTVNSPAEVPKAVDELVRWNPTAIFAVPLGGAGVPYFKALQQKLRVPRFTLSLFGNRQALGQLGDASQGLVVSQVMPNPDNVAVPVVKAYQAAMKKTGAAETSYASLEGYVGARVLAEALRRGGKNPARDRVVPMFLTMRPLDLGGYEVGYSASNHAGSNFVELAYFDGKRFRR
jgi:branched-chain amino acid transport system substrate-binding protein